CRGVTASGDDQHEGRRNRSLPAGRVGGVIDSSSVHRVSARGERDASKWGDALRTGREHFDPPTRRAYQGERKRCCRPVFLWLRGSVVVKRPSSVRTARAESV